MSFFLIAFVFCPFVIIFIIVLKKSVRIQEQIQQLEVKQQELLEANSLLAIEKEDLLKRQGDLDKELAEAIAHNAQKQQKLDEYAARQLEFHIIKFGRISAWGSPAYSISVDALGNVLYQGKTAVRKIGFYQWRIFRKRIQNINHVIKKSRFFEIEGNEFKSNIESISGVVIEIYLKNGLHKKIHYDHAANYPIDLGFLERKLDVILGTKKLWLYWAQNAVQISAKLGTYYKVSFLANQGIVYSISGQDYFSDEYLAEWPEINKVLVKYEALWSEPTRESSRNHPVDSIWVELETGFRFLITLHKHREAYTALAKVIEAYGGYLKQLK